MQTQTISQPYHVEGDKLVLDFHRGQWTAWDSLARFIVILAGTQGGKTSFGPHWLYREIQQRGPGDYMVVTPTYKLLNLKALPELLRIFKTILGVGDYKVSDKVFEFDAVGERRTWGDEQDEPTRILFGYATDPDSLESATAKAAWLDEAGQDKFKLSSYEAILRRLSLAQGRVLITTTPYNLGWLKQLFYDKRYERDDIDVIRFDSTENPSFPVEEMERARRDLPLWKFNMFYRAIFTRPAGMIYDCYDEAVHKIEPFAIPDNWPRFMGQDYGGVNTAAVWLAKDPKHGGAYYLYREYWEGGRTAKEHKNAMLADGRAVRAWGGANSEDQWRAEFAAAGLPVGRPPVSDVEVGIDRVYGALKRDELFIFDTCAKTLDQLASYSRELNDMGESTEKIADKETYHLLDALRYVGSALWKESVPSKLAEQPEQPSIWQPVGSNNGGGRWGKFND